MFRYSANVERDSLSASMIVRIIRAAEALGADRLKLIKNLGIDEARLRNPLSRLPSIIMMRLFAILERQFADPCIVLRLGQVALPQSFSDMSFATRLAPNLAAVIEDNVKIQILRQNLALVEFDQSAKPPILRWRHDSATANALAPLIEFSVATYAALAQHVLGEKILLRRIDFQHEPRCEISRYEDFFGCPVFFSAGETLATLAARQLFRPSLVANEKLRAAASAYFGQSAHWMAQGKNVAAQSYFYLWTQIDKSPPALDRMASAFGMTERSLRRKLVEEGYPFRALLDKVRQDLCSLYFMENKRSLSEIALLLGYSDLSAFTRSFKRWHGVAPSQI